MGAKEEYFSEHLTSEEKKVSNESRPSHCMFTTIAAFAV
jgi:hypothetical protein